MTLLNGSFKEYYSNVTSNPGTITVRSDNGGSDTATVTRPLTHARSRVRLLLSREPRSAILSRR